MNTAFEKFAEYNSYAIAWNQFTSGASKKENQANKHNSALKKIGQIINHNQSTHTKQLQRSNFLAIDEDISNENLMKNIVLFGAPSKNDNRHFDLNEDEEDRLR